MLNRSASLAMSTSVLKALPGKLDIKRHSPSILYLSGLTYEVSKKNQNEKKSLFEVGFWGSKLSADAVSYTPVSRQACRV